MRSARIRLATTALLAVVASSRPSSAAERVDPWLAADKGYHFAASATIAAGGYALGAVLFDARGHALILGGGLALTAGIGKEVLDLTGFGDPSWKDLTWDGIGTVAGLALAWSVDLLVRGVSKEHPLFLVPRIEPERAGLTVVVSF